jgi:hypothetical protein
MAGHPRAVATAAQMRSLQELARSTMSPASACCFKILSRSPKRLLSQDEPEALTHSLSGSRLGQARCRFASTGTWAIAQNWGGAIVDHELDKTRFGDEGAKLNEVAGAFTALHEPISRVMPRPLRFARPLAPVATIGSPSWRRFVSLSAAYAVEQRRLYKRLAPRPVRAHGQRAAAS